MKQFPACYLYVDSAVSFLFAKMLVQELIDKWAGVANALPEQRGLLQMDAINKYADSFSTNLHKWGLVGFDCCKFTCLLQGRKHEELTE